MLRLALDGHDDFVLSTLEIERGGMSYTIDTLLAIQSQMLDVELYLLMGADSLADFPFWRRPADICRIATPLVVSRAGEPLPHFEHLEPFVSPERLSQIASLQVNMPPQPIRSSDIRSLVASGGEWDAMVPEPVAHYIRKHRLYETTDRGR